MIENTCIKQYKIEWEVNMTKIFHDYETCRVGEILHAASAVDQWLRVQTVRSKVRNKTP